MLSMALNLTQLIYFFSYCCIIKLFLDFFRYGLYIVKLAVSRGSLREYIEGTSSSGKYYHLAMMKKNKEEGYEEG